MCLNIQVTHFDSIDFVAYDIFVLEHPDAKKSYSEMLIVQAYVHFNTMNDAQINLLEQNIITGPPDGERSYTRESIRAAIAKFIALSKQGLREDLFAFYKKSYQFLSWWELWRAQIIIWSIWPLSLGLKFTLCI